MRSKFDCREVESDSSERVVKRAFLFSIGLNSLTKFDQNSYNSVKGRNTQRIVLRLLKITEIVVLMFHLVLTCFDI